MSTVSPKRALATAATLLWMSVLVLGGWPGIVRPAFLDPANDVAVRTLRLFGMSAGQPLFQTDAGPWKQRGFCFFLREAGGPEARVLFPPGGECQIDGFHPRLPPVSRATHRMLASAWGLREGDAAARAESDGYLAAIGRAFCRADDPGPPFVEGVEGVWVWYYRNYDDGRVLRRNGLWFDYSCGSETLGEVVWHPTDAEIVARWGKAAW